MASIEIHGPRTIEAIPIPTAWPVVPPGNGKLNIMMMKQKAANSPNKGAARVFKVLLARLRAVYQKGVAAAYITAQVEGLR